ncbi:MAG: rod shape-determining protein [Patescibacteria group bacterium]|nr:rod shape-determining protein [Patescibacteria group bacterium]
MFSNLKKKFTPNLSIDLGTSNVIVHLSDKGIIINEPTVVAINNRTDQILEIGHEAKKMLGRTPPHISVIKPLINGIISDFEVTEKMLKYFIDKLHSDRILSIARPKVIIGVPINITEVEKKAVEDAVLSAGAKDVYLIEQPIAAALGSQININNPSGNLIVDLGGGKTEIAVISLGGIVNSKKTEIAGDKFNQNIIEAIHEEFNILLGQTLAEEVKINIGSAVLLKKEITMSVSGRDLTTGLPREIVLNDSQVRKALEKSLDLIIDDIKNTIETTPPELISDIYKKGIIVCGGGALLKGIDELISQKVKIPVTIVDDPLTCVIRGLAILHEDEKMLKNTVALLENASLIK